MKHLILRSWQRGFFVCILALACFSQILALPPGYPDASFPIYQPTFAAKSAGIYSLEILPDGGFIFAGTASFGILGSAQRPILERLPPMAGAAEPLADEACKSFPPFFASYRTSVLQPDGKLLVAGIAFLTTTPPINKYIIVRCNADATLDTTFNGTGIITDSFGPTDYRSNGNKILFSPDGKILVAGSYQPGVGSNEFFSVVQYNGNGTLDTSFGQGGKVVAAFAPNGAAYSAALQADGKVVLGGLTNNTFTLIRLLRDGSQDVSFGRRGVVQTYLGGNISLPYSIKLQPDGKIVAAGYTGTTSPQNVDFAITRYNPNGSLDNTFGTGGVVISDFNTDDRAHDVILQPNGKILACGGSSSAFSSSKFTVARYYPNGSLDLSFGQAGLAFLPTSGSCITLKLQVDGKIVAAGGGPSPANTVLAVRFKGGERAATVRFDFDGDGKADISGFRPSNSNWNLLRSTSGSTSIHWGLPTDVLVPADYDGDGKTNVAVYRDGAWKIVWSDGSYHQVIHGETDDLPRPGDFDGDGKADIALWRPSNGNWYWINSSDGQYKATHFGMNGDIPLIADFDGDGQTEIAVFRPSEGNWYYLRSSDGQYAAIHFGTTGDIPVVGDFDGDGKTDLSVFRPSNSFWYRLDSLNGQYFAQKFGTTDDVPVAADYDGDNKADLAVFRPSNSVWYILKSSDGLTGTLYGAAGDRPVPSVFLP